MKTIINTIERLLTETNDASHISELQADLEVMHKLRDDVPLTTNDARRFQDIIEYVYAA